MYGFGQKHTSTITDCLVYRAHQSKEREEGNKNRGKNHRRGKYRRGKDHGEEERRKTLKRAKLSIEVFY